MHAQAMVGEVECSAFVLRIRPYFRSLQDWVLRVEYQRVALHSLPNEIMKTVFSFYIGAHYSSLHRYSLVPVQRLAFLHLLKWVKVHRPAYSVAPKKKEIKKPKIVKFERLHHCTVLPNDIRPFD